jgi:hypothetical protein
VADDETWAPPSWVPGEWVRNVRRFSADVLLENRFFRQQRKRVANPAAVKQQE